MSKIKDIFNFQKKLQKGLYGIELPKYDIKLASKYAFGIFTELGEALAEDKSWKDWRKQKEEVNYNDLKEEIADVWIFLINYTLANNLDANDILEEIIKKQNKLKERHDL